MNKDSILYWSSLSTYENCPQALLWGKGWDGIDLGNGPGKAKTRPPQGSAHHALMGIVIQAVVEKMYNEELYKDPANLTRNLLAAVEREWSRMEAKPRNMIDYGEARMSREEMLQVCRDGVSGYIQTMKAHKFLGPYARAEFDLVGWIDKWNPVGGRPDVIVRRDDTGVTILDGKNSKQKSKYLDPDQLRWYALLFKLFYKELPSRLAFVMYRFPYGAPGVDDKGEPITETGVEWIPFTEEDLRGLAQRALDAKKAMWKEKFDPTPTPNGCKFCDFEKICPARKDQRIANAEKRGPRESATVEEISAGSGFVDLFSEG